MNALATATAVVLAALAALHVFWGIRGGSASSSFVPEAGGKPLFRPRPVDCFAVAAALAAAAFLVLSARGLVASPLPPSWTRAGTTAVGAAFVLRSIGEFRYAGFFKRVRGTRFARLDTLVFSPLCLALGLAGLAVAWL